MTRVCHTLRALEGEPPGFDFLGVTVRHFPCGKTKSARNPYGRVLGRILLIKPSRTAIGRHVDRLREIIRQYRHAPQFLLIAEGRHELIVARLKAVFRDVSGMPTGPPRRVGRPAEFPAVAVDLFEWVRAAVSVRYPFAFDRPAA